MRHSTWSLGGEDIPYYFSPNAPRNHRLHCTPRRRCYCAAAPISILFISAAGRPRFAVRQPPRATRPKGFCSSPRTAPIERKAQRSHAIAWGSAETQHTQSLPGQNGDQALFDSPPRLFDPPYVPPRIRKRCLFGALQTCRRHRLG